MAASVIHVGQDTCHRLAVLESVGYRVKTCVSIPELQQTLADQAELDAVVISEGADGAHLDAVLLARTQTSVPIVLFRDTQLTFAESSFDLVVPILAPPETWLAEMASLIDQFHALQADCRVLQQQSAELRRSSAAVRAKSEAERQRARTEYGKKFPLPNGLVGGPGKPK